VSFGNVIGDFPVSAIDKCEQALRKISIDLFTNVVNSTPVQDGRAKVDPSGSKTISKINDVVGGVNGDFVLYLTNNLPYIARLEEGYSPQAAPGEMVQLNALKAKKTLAKIVRSLS